MNNQEEKEQFFALYYGQKVYMNHPNCTNPSNYFMKQSTKANDYLLLKPLYEITEEDAFEVSKLCRSGDDKSVNNIMKWANIYAMQSSKITDFLRSKGYALPFKGISVEEQISRGWIKLKE